MRRKGVVSLPEDILLRIFEIGIQRCMFGLRDLYSISLTCKLFTKLWKEPSLWSLLLYLDSRLDESPTLDLYSSSPQTTYKYKLGRFIKNRAYEIAQSIENYQRKMSSYAEWVQFIQDKLARKSPRDRIRIRKRIGMTNKRLQMISELLSSGMDKWKKVIDLCIEVSMDLDAPAVKAQSSSPSSSYSSFTHSRDGFRKKMDRHLRALGGLRKKIDTMLSVHRDKISSYAWQKDVACTLVRTQLENYEELILLTSRLTLLSSGSNPIKTGGLTGDCDYEHGDYDSDDGDIYNFDYCGDI